MKHPKTDVVRLSVVGEFDAEHVSQVKQLTMDGMKRGAFRYILDLRGCTGLALSVPGMISYLPAKLQQYGGGFKVAGSPDYIWRYFEASGYSALFDRCSSIATALDKFAQEAML